MSRSCRRASVTDWTGLSYQERQAGSQTAPLYAFSILVIFLCLAALYESWPIPIAILLTLPLGAIGGVIGTTLRGLPNDVYFQIGLLTTLGLTTKNAILIVQFAKARVEQGMGLIDATLEGAKLRLRPILMTSLAFGFGVLPLTFANGAGAGAQKAIGTAVLGGVVTSTFLVTIFRPAVLRRDPKDPGQTSCATSGSERGAQSLWESDKMNNTKQGRFGARYRFCHPEAKPKDLAIG